MKPITFLGLLIAYFSITALNLLFKGICGSPLNDAGMVTKELLIFLMVGVLLWIVLRKENLTLESVGLHHRAWGKSLWWALVMMVISFALLLGLLAVFQRVGMKFGEGGGAFDQLSPFTRLLVILRAGVAEEVFLRGYIIERLEKWTGSTWLAVALSLVPFALLHYAQGWAGIIIAFVAGLVLSVMYVWRRDLKSNIIAHFTIDFIPNFFLT